MKGFLFCKLGLAAILSIVLSPAMSMAQEAPAPKADEVEFVPLGMDAVKAFGLGEAFEDLGFNFYGWAQQSFTFGFDDPPGRALAGRVFDDNDDDYRFNQLNVNLERALTGEKDEFAVGFKLQGILGTDARFIHSRGLFGSAASGGGRDTASIQFDPTQFYMNFRFPVGEGLNLKLGKSVTMLGAEVIDAPTNALFSRSFGFGFSIPFTHTGFQFDYPIMDEFKVYWGMNQGWDVWTDNNDSWTHMMGVYGNLVEGKLFWILNAITGPEQRSNESDDRTVIDLVLTYAWTDEISTSLNADIGWEDDVTDNDGDGIVDDDDTWGGLAAYMTYRWDPRFAFTFRGEYFGNDNGSRLAGFVGDSGNPDVDVLGLTFGVDIYPMNLSKNVRIRPEIRWDQCLDNDKGFDGGTSDSQVTIAMDLLLLF